MLEKIWKAAMKYKGSVYSMEPPARHHDIIHMLSLANEGKTIGGPQGFLTDTGRFVRRNEAMTIAKAAGQITKPTQMANILFSEDLW